MRENGRLHKDVDLQKLAEQSKNFSGAEIEGLVKSAASFALYGSVDITKEKVEAKIDTDNIIVTMAHFERALSEVIPAFGTQDDELKTLMRGQLHEYSPEFVKLLNTGRTWCQQCQASDNSPLLSVLLEGESGSGKTALAAKLATDANFPYTKVISPEMYISYTENAKCTAINKVFEDAYKSPASLIVIDNIERLLEYVPMGPRFSNQVLQTLLILIKKLPPTEGRKLMVIATTSSLGVLKDLEFKQAFNAIAKVPQLSKPEHIIKLFESVRAPIEKDELDKIANSLVQNRAISVKQLLMVIEMAKQGVQTITADRFMECVHDAGLEIGDSSKMSFDMGDSKTS